MFAYKVIGLIGMVSYTAAFITGRVPRMRYNRYRIVAVPRHAMPDMPKGYGWRNLSAGDLSAHAIDVDSDVQADRFAQNLDCLGIFDRKDTLVGVSWIGSRHHYEGDLAIRFTPPAGSAWDTGLWVPDDKRMGRAFAATWGAIGAWLDSQSLDWSISCIADYNIASILAHERMQAKTLGHVTILQIGRFQISFGAKPLLCWLRPGHMPDARISLPPSCTETYQADAEPFAANR